MLGRKPAAHLRASIKRSSVRRPRDSLNRLHDAIAAFAGERKSPAGIAAVLLRHKARFIGKRPPPRGHLYRCRLSDFHRRKASAANRLCEAPSRVATRQNGKRVAARVNGAEISTCEQLGSRLLRILVPREKWRAAQPRRWSGRTRSPLASSSACCGGLALPLDFTSACGVCRTGTFRRGADFAVPPAEN